MRKSILTKKRIRPTLGKRRANPDRRLRFREGDETERDGDQRAGERRVRESVESSRITDSPKSGGRPPYSHGRWFHIHAELGVDRLPEV